MKGDSLKMEVVGVDYHCGAQKLQLRETELDWIDPIVIETYNSEYSYQDGRDVNSYRVGDRVEVDITSNGTRTRLLVRPGKAGATEEVCA